MLGGEPYALQKKALDRKVDVVVASPGRLMQHKEQGNVYLSQVGEGAPATDLSAILFCAPCPPSHSLPLFVVTPVVPHVRRWTRAR